MSILIKGMEMPESCVDCDLVHISENSYGDILGFSCPLIYKGYIHENTGRLPDCPLVELPPHGRLIDGDEFKLTFCKECTLYPDKCLKDECDWHSIMHLRMMPTVIEAEEGE